MIDNSNNLYFWIWSNFKKQHDTIIFLGGDLLLPLSTLVLRPIILFTPFTKLCFRFKNDLHAPGRNNDAIWATTLANLD